MEVINKEEERYKETDEDEKELLRVKTEGRDLTRPQNPPLNL